MKPERKDVTIFAVPAEAFARAPVENIQHACPCCNGVFDWPTFVGHIAPCLTAHPEWAEKATKGEN
jgi:hypothetical protein